MENQGVAFVLDLTERKRAEEALRESERKLRQITRNGIGIWLRRDLEGKKAEITSPEFMAQVQAVLNVLPAYTVVRMPPSGSLTFASRRHTDLPWSFAKDHPATFRHRRLAHRVGTTSRYPVCCIRTTKQAATANALGQTSLGTGEGYAHNLIESSGAQGNYRWLTSTRTRTAPRQGDGTTDC